ncbi:Uu.00g143770.m01.CDS01 [Anthostomella pinea]|uniref:Uu.00g143770.m01.CDS01 n=1 Tax=Anthostomella pinea TaxID=933095 RepID=A0AAI8VQU1_9PEZI|nr:Uu.00g143770.m01.CDS01 [Anthostomella pinea]
MPQQTVSVIRPEEKLGLSIDEGEAGSTDRVEIGQNHVLDLPRELGDEAQAGELCYLVDHVEWRVGGTGVQDVIAFFGLIAEIDKTLGGSANSRRHEGARRWR